MNNEIRVLHVDDEPDFADLASHFLSQYNRRFSITTALDADEAQDVLQTHSVDCVVSDYDMPGKNGIDLLEAVRELIPDLPFILFTGKGSEEIASEAISAGVTDYLQKESGTDQYVILANRIENAVDKVRAERRADDAHALYQSLTEDALDTSKDGTIILDSNFDIEWINSAIELYFDLDRNEAIGEDKRDLIDSHIASIFESPEEYAETVTATFDDNTYIEEFECHILPTENREERWLRHWSQPIETGRLAGGRIEHYTDITEFKEREQEITRLKELHEMVLANIRDAVFITDDDGQFTYICPNVEFTFGYDREDVAALGSIEALFGGQLVEATALAEQGEVHNIEKTVANQAGESRHLLVTVSAVDIEEGSQLYSIRDITDRADRERSYRELSRRHELALEATETGVWEWNMETDEVVWSNTLERLLGLEPGVFGGTFEDYAEFLHPDAVDTIERAIEQALGGGEIFDEEFQMIRADGEVLWVHSKGNVYTDDGPERMLGIITDVTEWKGREQRLEDQKERLEEFASVLSHDLRTPITVATGRLGIYRETGDDSNLDKVEQSLRRIDELVTDLTILARRGTIEGEHELISLPDLVQETWSQIDTRSASLTTEECTVHAHRSQLMALLENLIRNAIVHGGPGVTVRVGPMEDGFYLEDTGRGVAPEDREHIFERGFTTGYRGSGIGLTIVNRIAQAHGWTVSLSESKEGGARFEITGVDSGHP